MKIDRFVAVGDSITEGLSDKSPFGGYRGWADRVADELARHSSDFRYANFAVRGKLLEQIVEEQIPLALPLITGPTTLFSFHAGANNFLRPKVNIGEVINLYSTSVEKISSTGVTLLLFTIREIHNPRTPLEKLWNQRFEPYNINVRATAERFNAFLIDPNDLPALGDRRLLAADRLHLSSEGHRRMAAAALSSIGYPHDSDWKEPLPKIKESPQALEAVKTVGWVSLFLIPWILRRALGRSSGERRSAKYGQLTPWPVNRTLD